MKVVISENAEELGKKAAERTAALLNQAIRDQGSARLLLSTGASQFTTLEALVKEDVDWSKVELFHLDEYIGLPDNHPASFVRYLKERFVEKIGTMKALHFVNTKDGVDQIIEKLTRELGEGAIDVGLIGIGENAHIAFNDPPADFTCKKSYIVVHLDAVCRNQQLGEGWFPSLDAVPTSAVSMTVHQILQCRHIISSVPYGVKAKAIKNTLEQDVSPYYPATILKEHKDAILYLDQESASLLEQATVEKYRLCGLSEAV